MLKFNANQRYATTSITSTILREIARKADVPLQVLMQSNWTHTLRCIFYFRSIERNKIIFVYFRWIGIFFCYLMLEILLRVHALTAKLFDRNFHPLEIVSSWRDPQLQVHKHYSDLRKRKSTILKFCCLRSRFIFVYVWKLVLNVLIENWKSGYMVKWIKNSNWPFSRTKLRLMFLLQYVQYNLSWYVHRHRGGMDMRG